MKITEIMRKLEEIENELENGVDIERAVELFEEAVKLYKDGVEKIEESRKKLEMLMEELRKPSSKAF